MPPKAGALKTGRQADRRDATRWQASSAAALLQEGGRAPVVQHEGNVEQQVEDVALAVPEVPAAAEMGGGQQGKSQSPQSA